MKSIEAKNKKADYFEGRSAYEKFAIHLAWMMIRNTITKKYRVTAADKYAAKSRLAKQFNRHPKLLENFTEVTARSLCITFLKKMESMAYHPFSETMMQYIKAMMQH